jgi:pentatricopeptide repeat protein
MADGREHGPKFNIGFFNRMFQGLSEAGRIDDALKVYGRMHDKEIKPNKTTFEILVNTLCKEGELDKALDLVRDMARGGVVAPPTEFCEQIVEIFRNADRQEEIEEAFEEKPVPMPPQPRPEYRPRSSPQGLPGFASNQTRGSYTPHQGQSGYGSPQPFHHGNVVPQMQAESMPSESQKPGYGTPQPQQSTHIAHQTQHPGFGTSRPWQTGYGSQAQQPGYGPQQAQQPGYGSHQAQQTGYGSHRTHQAQQPSYGAHQPSQPPFAPPEALEPGIGTARSPSHHGHIGNQHDQFESSPQGGQKLDTQQPQDSSAPAAPQSSLSVAQGLPHYGHTGNQFGAQVSDTMAVKYAQRY